jgi:gliding motility-associated-like protein
MKCYTDDLDTMMNVILSSNAVGVKLQGDGAPENIDIKRVLGSNWQVAGLYPEASGAYTYTITSQTLGCESVATANDTLNFTLNVGAPKASFTVNSEKFVVPFLVEFNNTSTGATGYKWGFADEESDANMSQLTNTTHNYVVGRGDDEPYVVTLIANYDNQCYDTYTLDLTGYRVVVPNIFTPNEDGINDLFLLGPEGVESVDIVIYNRWGRKVAEWAEIDGSWNGKAIGTNMDCSTGTYYYTIKFVGVGEAVKNVNGSFYLTR